MTCGKASAMSTHYAARGPHSCKDTPQEECRLTQKVHQITHWFLEQHLTTSQRVISAWEGTIFVRPRSPDPLAFVTLMVLAHEPPPRFPATADCNKARLHACCRIHPVPRPTGSAASCGLQIASHQELRIRAAHDLFRSMCKAALAPRAKSWNCPCLRKKGWKAGSRVPLHEGSLTSWRKAHSCSMQSRSFS